MLPNFIGIGVPRAGTTWLHELLDMHPDVAVPQRRKEVHFFDRYYDKGMAWYSSFFPPDHEAVYTIPRLWPRVSLQQTVRTIPDNGLIVSSRDSVKMPA